MTVTPPVHLGTLDVNLLCGVVLRGGNAARAVQEGGILKTVYDQVVMNLVT